MSRRTWSPPEANQLVALSSTLAGVATMAGAAAGYLAAGDFFQAAALFSLLAVIAAAAFWHLTAKLRRALALTFTWGECSHAGVTWGWRHVDVGVVLGPYCPDHGCLLTLHTTGALPHDGDVIGPGNPLHCAHHERQHHQFWFDERSLSGVSVGKIRENVRQGLNTLGVWRRIGH